MTPHGTLYLLPVPLSEAPEALLTLSPRLLDRFRQLSFFVVETPKTARRLLKRIDHPLPIAQLTLSPLPQEATMAHLESLLAPLRLGHSLGLLSDAGCPAIADPGARLVNAAHAAGFRVVPETGPSSLLLGLMASGLEGQRFAFHGYLPVPEMARNARLIELEKRSRAHQETQSFIETPYRNEALFASLCRTLHPMTQLCVARDLTGPQEWIRTTSVSEWRHRPPPDLHHFPTLFLFLAHSSGRSG
ncbi:SAM-dependent methyltransferase [Ferrovum sp.]|uniref:SAM-dependent methyltransferase n=1 Tax=Ferrovum sp. TaxID=2609467 RepID=UPI002617B578|nr:SAM-dependent methyltransferase [Ferrovum sp.]